MAMVKIGVFHKKPDRKITMLTCYDYPTALIEDGCGIDIIFVGDSVGTNVLGYNSETEVTMNDMVHHLKAVRRGVKNAYLLVDMPYKSYETPEQALDNAKIFLSHGADGLKLEGAKFEIVRCLSKNGIDVVGHLGLNPQTHLKKAVQGKTFGDAKRLIEDSLELEKSGIRMLVLELIPEEIAKIITEKIKVPTIGIGAGRFCDGQVLVVNDLLGMNRTFKHSKRYENIAEHTAGAVSNFRLDVSKGNFPGEENVFHMGENELTKINAWLEK